MFSRRFRDKDFDDNNDFVRTEDLKPMIVSVIKETLREELEELIKQHFSRYINKVVEKKRRMKSLRSVNMVEHYLLKGKVFCGYCDTTMWIKGGGKVVNGNVYRYYFCNDREKKRNMILLNRTKSNQIENLI